MSELNLPEPKNPQQARAYALLRQIAAGDLSRSELIEMNRGRAQDTKHAIRFLRDHRHIHIAGGVDIYPVDPIYRFGPGVDAPYVWCQRPAHTPGAALTPRPDPLMAALFGRQG